ncbi:MAG: hypothetical protein M0Q38_08890 [Bacteroidales bacterium]|jgi:hypothetical protein|nr:hypothetical protein [Bacteroidales bacterium]
MKITEIKYYDGSRKKLCQLGLADLFFEIQEIMLSTKINLMEAKDANGGAEVRKLIDNTFQVIGTWDKATSGSIDWMKSIRFNRTFIATIGVEVQVSARSDLLIRDIVHLRNKIQAGEIEVGIIVVPSERMQLYLPDRTPSIKDAKKYIEQEFQEAMTYPIVLMAVEHDGPGYALQKQKRKS